MVVVEVVFVYPGVGQLMVDSVIKRDIPVVQGCALVFALTYILLIPDSDLIKDKSNILKLLLLDTILLIVLISLIIRQITCRTAQHSVCYTSGNQW